MRVTTCLPPFWLVIQEIGRAGGPECDWEPVCVCVCVGGGKVCERGDLLSIILMLLFIVVWVQGKFLHNACTGAGCMLRVWLSAVQTACWECHYQRCGLHVESVIISRGDCMLRVWLSAVGTACWECDYQPWGLHVESVIISGVDCMLRVWVVLVLLFRFIWPHLPLWVVCIDLWAPADEGVISCLHFLY